MSSSIFSHAGLVRRLGIACALLGIALSGCVPDVVPSSGPSCRGLAATCGPNKDESCCARSLPVPGGAFNRFDDPTLPAHVSSFVLDRFEVTVGRFRRYVDAYPGNLPSAGAGAFPNTPASGWSSAWNSLLPADQPSLITAVECDPTYATWTSAPGPNEDKPMNCLSWFQAFAFCAWEGGRLATQTEWSYAAEGGKDQRLYPWKDGPPGAANAIYGCTDTTTCMTFLEDVGSRSPSGDGAFGHADLAGSLWEWTLDELDPTLSTSCSDCVDDDYPTSPANGGFRVRLGGSWRSGASELEVNESNRDNLAPWFAGNDIGVRCAWDL